MNDIHKMLSSLMNKLVRLPNSRTYFSMNYFLKVYIKTYFKNVHNVTLLHCTSNFLALYSLFSESRSRMKSPWTSSLKNYCTDSFQIWYTPSTYQIPDPNERFVCFCYMNKI